MNNPYSLVFGKEPPEQIPRVEKKRNVVNSFLEDTQRVFMITGVRGSGKTVFLNDIKKMFREMDDWVTVELSTERDMLNGLVGKLSNEEKLSAIFKSAKINLSFLGFGLEVKGVAPVTDIEVAVKRLLEALKKSGKKLLVLADEAVDNQYVREFVSVFQIMIRDELPIYLLMTGLYENIDDLQNEKNLTFLHRAPKLGLGSLNIGAMAESYKREIKVDDETSIRMAQLTKGYSFAFQVLGYCTWNNGGDYKKAIPETKQYLDEYIYDKIWFELSDKDKKILSVIARSSAGEVKEIREMLNLKPNEFSPYRKRLVRKGVISEERGVAKITLPFFDRYIIENYY